MDSYYLDTGSPSERADILIDITAFPNVSNQNGPDLSHTNNVTALISTVLDDTKISIRTVDENAIDVLLESHVPMGFTQ